MRLADKLRQMDSDRIPFDAEKVASIVEEYFTTHRQGSFTVDFSGYEIIQKKDPGVNYVMPRHWFNAYRDFMSDNGFIMEPSYGRSGYEMTWRLY